MGNKVAAFVNRFLPNYFPDPPLLGYYKLDPKVPDPIFATQASACFDLRSSADILIAPKSVCIIPTGLILDIPLGYFVKLHIRSSVSLRGLLLANGTGIIDQDYTEPVGIIVYNYVNVDYKITFGDRIAQGELVQKPYYTFKQLEQRPAQKTDRTGGFGSTGTK